MMAAWAAGAQPAARDDGRHRQPAVLPPRLDEQPINSFLDAIYIVPRRIGRVSCGLPAPRPPERRSTSSARRTSRSRTLDPALTRPGRMGRHVWFRTPTKEDRKDIFDLYLGKVAHDPSSTRAARGTRSRGSRTATRRR
jgi:hypothetical protein